LRFSIDPVPVLEDHEDRLRLALPDQKALDGVERPFSALRLVAQGRTATSAANRGRSTASR
jgi:hypothetical protein